MFDQVKQYILQRVNISEEDLDKAFAYAIHRQYKKGEFIIRLGEYCRWVGFLNAGLIVATSVNESGKEVTSSIVFENNFFTYAEGIHANIPSHKNFIALEDCDMLLLEKDKMPLIFTMNQKFETLFTQILAEELNRLLLADHNRRTLSAENRYLHFINMYPGAFNRIPLKHIAGYLGIEPPSLSRLRRRLAGK